MITPEFTAALTAYLEKKTPLYQALGMTRSLPAAEELVQAAAVKALEKHESYDSAKPLGAWFYYVMLNLRRNDLAKSKKTLSLDAPLGVDDGDDSLTHADLLESDAPMLEAAMLQSNEEATLSEKTRIALSSLRAPERMAIVAKDLHGLDWPECAAALGCTIVRIKTIVRNGRAQFRSCYAALEAA